MALDELGECFQQSGLVLDRLDPAYGTNDKAILLRELGRKPIGGSAWTRCKAFRIDPVVDLADPTSCDADTADQIALQVLGHNDVPVYQRRMKAPQNRGPPSCTVEIAYVPTMLAMNAMTHARKFCRR